MNFQRGRSREEPEINLIPMIDVLLVILIFLMVTTTYSKFAGLEINLPSAELPVAQEKPGEIDVVVMASGALLINQAPVTGGIEAIAQALQKAAAGITDPIVVINADAKTAHQHVIDVMQAARNAGLTQISFATQQKSQ